jgi:hypothetical protein
VAAGLEKLVAPGVDVAWDGETDGETAGQARHVDTHARDPGGATPASATAHFTLARLVRVDVATRICTVEVDAAGSTVAIPTSEVLQLLSQAQVQELRVAQSAQVAAAGDGVGDLRIGQGGSVGDGGGDMSDADDDIMANDASHEDGGQSSSFRADGKPDRTGNTQKLRQLLPEIPVGNFVSFCLFLSSCFLSVSSHVSGHLAALWPLNQWQLDL